jgi:endoglucanase
MTDERGTMDTDANRMGIDTLGPATTVSRRGFLRAAAGAGVLSVSVGSQVASAATSEGIPTPWLHRDGKWIKDPSDNKVTLRGVNVIDPARAVVTAWRRSVPKTIEHATDEDRNWYSRVIRVPIQPADIVKDGKGYGARVDPGVFSQSDLERYLGKYVDPVVEKGRDIGVYIILDYHRHKDATLKYTNGALDEEVTMFWETVAPRYADKSHVLYEVYNEPISPFIGFRQRDVNVPLTDPRSKQTWETWKETAQPWVDTIRKHASQNLILIGSPRWSQFTYWAAKDEFEGDNLAYTGHVYAHPNLRPLSKYFGTPAETVPVFMSEFGYAAEGNKYFQGTNAVEGQQFVDFYETYENVSWQVWCFDHIWAPPMFRKPNTTNMWILLDGNKHHGKFFRDYLAQKRNANIPGSEQESDQGSDLAPIDGAQPTDPDGDGKYEDVNGNNQIDFDDVTTYFEHMDESAITDHAAYDYNANGQIDYNDLVSLFQEQ